MGKTHSKTLAARHGRGTAWARHVTCESALSVLCLKHTIHHTAKNFWTRVAGSGDRNRETQVYASQFQPAAAWSGWLRWSN